MVTGVRGERVATDALRWKPRGAGIWAVVMLVCLGLAQVAWSTPAWAVSADELLDLMVDEGAITPEKAQKIKEKARKIDKVKKAEEDAKRAQELQQVKQEAKTEAKAEAKAEAAKEVAAGEKRVEQKAASWIPKNLPEPLKGLKIGVLAYVDYSVGDSPRFMGPIVPQTGKAPVAGNFGRNVDGHVGLNQFSLTRGYLNVVKEITPWLYARWTPDLTLNNTNNAGPLNPGNGANQTTGWILREKYLYGELRPGNLGNVLTQNKAEIGLGHTPWHDFEESLYPYRCQGTIPMERAGVFNSADIGANIRGYFGGELANAKEVLGNDAYAGRYGSWHVGIYNGAGYTAGENNQNKVPEYRVTIRPLPDLLPGLQASYFGLYGKGNSSSAANYGTPFAQFYPDWVVNQGYLIYQHPWFMLTAQMFASKGNQAGVWTTQNTGPVPIGARADSLWTRGYSVFGDVKVPVALSIPYWQGDQQYPLHAFYRTDWFNADQNHEIAESAKYTKLITGLAYHIYKDNMILLAYEKTWYGRDYAIQGGTGPNGQPTARVVSAPGNGSNLGTDQRFQVVYQVSY